MDYSEYSENENSPMPVAKVFIRLFVLNVEHHHQKLVGGTFSSSCVSNDEDDEI